MISTHCSSLACLVKWWSEPCTHLLMTVNSCAGIDKPSRLPWCVFQQTNETQIPIFILTFDCSLGQWFNCRPLNFSLLNSRWRSNVGGWNQNGGQAPQRCHTNKPQRTNTTASYCYTRGWSKGKNDNAVSYYYLLLLSRCSSCWFDLSSTLSSQEVSWLIWIYAEWNINHKYPTFHSLFCKLVVGASYHLPLETTTKEIRWRWDCGGY